jgi:hypothetical protein
MPGRHVGEPGGDTTHTGRRAAGLRDGTQRTPGVWPGAGAWRAPEPMTVYYKTEWCPCDLLRRIKPASSSMASATNAAIPVNPSAPGQSATLLTWTAGKHLGLRMSMTFDGTGWLGEPY